MKDAFWLRHDSNAQHDERILELRAEYGWEGYGLFWAIVERMRDAQDYRLAMATMGGLATSMGLLKPKMLAVLELCCTHGLFAMEEEGAYVYSPSLRRRMEEWDTKKAALAEAGKRGQAAKQARKAEATLADETSQAEATLKPPLSHPGDFLSIEEKSREEEIRQEEPLPSVEGAGAEEMSEEQSLLESPTIAPQTEGGAADVGTPMLAAAPVLTKQKGGQWKYDPADIHPGLVLPFDTDSFRQMWATYRQFREEDGQRRLTGGLQEQEVLRNLGNMAAGSEAAALEIIQYTIRGGYKNLCKQDARRPNPQQNAIGQPAGGAKPTGAAVGIAAALVQRRFEQQRSGPGATGQATGPHPGQSAAVGSGIGPH